jgi:hypothetical protein
LGALLDRACGEHRIVVHRKYDDFGVRISLEHSPQQFESRNAGEINIEHDHVGRRGGMSLQRLVGIVSLDYFDVGLTG